MPSEPVHKKHSITVAVLLSALACPGAGQLYYRRYVRGGLLVAASLALTTLLVYTVWTRMFDVMMSTPPDRVMGDIFGIAHRIAEQEDDRIGWVEKVFAALWVYGVADALVRPAGEREGR